MTWSRLAFIHWPISAAQLRPLIPPQLEIDTFDNSAWIGVVPFYMSGVRHRRLPPLPGCADFPELNVRTYVTCDGKPGVWFLSLDAMSRFVVFAARTRFDLPYYYADMACRTAEQETHYQSNRRRPRPSPSDLASGPIINPKWWVQPRGPARFEARYRPIGAAYQARPGSLDFFLTARYCLYSCRSSGEVCRGEIDHRPWQLQPAEIEIRHNTMTAALDLSPADVAPLVHYVDSIETVAWPLCQTTASAAEAPAWSELARP